MVEDMRWTSILPVIAFALFATQGVAAQTSLSEIKKNADKQTAELEEVDLMLSDSNQSRRIANMMALIGSGNPFFVKRATEAGLFSSDIEMQNAALTALFDSGGPFRIIVDMTTAKDDDSGVKQWMKTYDGSWNEDETVATYIFRTAPYSAEMQCWPFADGRNCGFIMSGGTVSIKDWGRASGSFKLAPSGQLVGDFRNTYKPNAVPVPAVIPLVE